MFALSKKPRRARGVCVPVYACVHEFVMTWRALESRGSNFAFDIFCERVGDREFGIKKINSKM